MKSAILAMCAGAALLVGCAKPISLNGGPLRDPKDIAIIETNPQGFYNSGYLYSIDHIEVGNAHVQVDPGVHEIRVAYQSSPGAPSPGLGASLTIGPKPRIIKFEAKKGLAYYPYWCTMWMGNEPEMRESVSGENVTFIERKIVP